MITALLVIQAVAILLLGVLVVGLLRSHADITRALHQLGVGDPSAPPSPRPVAPRPVPRPGTEMSPDIAGSSLSGSAVHVGVSGQEGRTLLAFLSSGCSACGGLWEGLRTEPLEELLPGVRLVLVTKGPEAESPSRLQELAPRGTTLVQSTEAWEAYRVPVSPYFVMVDGSQGRVIGEGSATSWAQVASLLAQALADSAIPGGPGREEELRADAELRRAGIGPGHPSLYPDRPPSRE